MPVPHYTRLETGPDAAPAIVSTSSHRDTATPLRRFIGQLPVDSGDSHASKVQRSRLHRLKREAISHLRSGDDDDNEEDGEIRRDVFGEHGHGVRNRIRRIRVKRRSDTGEELEEEYEVPEDDELEHGLWRRKKGTTGLPIDEADKWFGESFDIGQEYEDLGAVASPVVEDASSTRTESTARDIPRPIMNGGQIHKSPETTLGPSSQQTERPSLRTQSTQDSFFTARTGADSIVASSTNHDEHEHLGPADDTSHSNHAVSPHSSLQPLISERHGEQDDPSNDKGTARLSASPSMQRLKSVIGGASFGSKTKDRKGRKSVSFSVAPAKSSLKSQTPTKPPADPVEVLARAGGEVEGTSAGAHEAALESQGLAELDSEEALNVTDAVLQDRLLVRVAEHRDEGLARFDESIQRRNPCRRMDPFEEFIAVLRKGRVELYQRWTNPFNNMFRKTLRLCFIIPLRAAQTTLSVFNETDMSIALVTSVSKFADGIETLSRRQTGRSRALIQRVTQSKQYQWVRSLGDSGSHIFILKLGERSRAIDWYWEIWRDLGGELPKMVDISAPAFVAQVRLAVKDTGDDGGASAAREYSPKAIVRSCWKSLEESVNVEGQDGEDLKLAWRDSDGMLEWLAYDTTVEGRPRNWGLLATLAMWEAETNPRVLQLRHTTHQPHVIKLDDGSVLERPAGVEGYLIRHTPGAKAKDHLYIFTYDGSMFVSTQHRARPPYAPGKPGSLPADLFPKVYDEFKRGEDRRLAQSIARSSGFVDMRNVKQIKLCPDEADKGFFDIHMGGEPHRFEAHTKEAAEEWVTRLQKLLEYWKQRHRVEARMRMDVMAYNAKADPFVDTALAGRDDAALSEIWNWCAIEGCSGVNMTGRLFMKKGVTDKFRAKYIVLSGGTLVSFKIKARKMFYPKRHRYSLFGAYVYSGMFAQEEVREPANASVFSTTTRRYIDGLVSSDGSEDTTFCVRLFAGKKKSGWGKQSNEPWAQEDAADADTEQDDLRNAMTIPPLSVSPPRLLIFRAKSKLERDKWVWAINAEMERQVRSHLISERALRYGSGNLP